MKIYRYLLGLFVAAALVILPIQAAAHYDVSRPEIPVTSAMEPMAPEVYIGQFDFADDMELQAFGLASVDLCYMGSLIDPATGETMDLFGYCTDDAISGNFDLA